MAAVTTPTECAICLASFKAGESISGHDANKVSHIFHTTCFEDYRKVNSSAPCPLCRGDSKQFTRREFTSVSSVADSHLSQEEEKTISVAVIDEQKKIMRNLLRNLYLYSTDYLNEQIGTLNNLVKSGIGCSQEEYTQATENLNLPENPLMKNFDRYCILIHELLKTLVPLGTLSPEKKSEIALHIAQFGKGDVELMEIIIKNNVEQPISEEIADKILCLAVERDSELESSRLIQFLLANCSISDVARARAKELALQKGHQKCAALLHKSSCSIM